MKHYWPFLLFGLWLQGVLGSLSAADTSQLWGVAGEKWSPESRLPDFSHAGYRRGEENFRIPPASISVKSFGAKGDGRTDDTAAFKKALSAGAGKVIQVPAGRYLLSDVLEIRTSNLVLRGAGTGKSILIFTKSLEELRPSNAKTDGGQPTTQWSWNGGLISIGSKVAKTVNGIKVTADAKRGTNRIRLEQAPFKPGSEIVLFVRDDSAKSLVNYLYRGQCKDISGLNNWMCRQVFRVVSAAGNDLALDRALRFDARQNWNPVVEPFQPSVTDVGIEGFSFEFPAKSYAGHFKEVGFNPVCIESGAAHCWLRDIRIWNADSGPYINGTFCTVSGIHLGADPARLSAQGHTGHHGISCYGHDNLCTNFVVDTSFIHDVTVQSAMGCVYCQGRAVNLNMDHHRWAPYENLFTDIDAGEGKRLFSSSGGGNRGPHTAAGATFWNIRTRQTISWPTSMGIDDLIIVGLNLRGEPQLNPSGRWFEPIPPEKIQPANLHAAMFKKRVTARSSK